MIDELQHRESVGDGKKKVLEMLQRLEEPEDDEEWDDLDSDDNASEEGAELADRLAEVDLNNADAVWDRLTDEEKQEFKSIVYNGEIEKIVKNVEPWWALKLEVKMVSDVQADEAKEGEILERCPKVRADIKDFQDISTKTPAPCIVYNIANVIGAYTYIFRYYNGDHLSYEREAADNLISICENLRGNANFECIASVADSIMLNCHNWNLFSDLNTKKAVLEDTKDIFDGPGDEKHFCSYLLSALSDILRLLKTAKHKRKRECSKDPLTSDGNKNKKFSSEFCSGAQNSEFQMQNQSHIVGCLKKLEFYISFVKFKYNRTEWPVNWEIM